MKSAVFFDIDGTLATYQREITPAVRAYIKKLQVEGTSVFLCSGRGISDLPESITEIDFDGCICSTGAYIVSRGQVIYNQLIPSPVLADLYFLLKELCASCYFDTDKALYRLEAGPSLLSQYEEITSAGLLEALPVNSLSYRTPSRDISHRLISYLEQHCRVIPYTDTFGDVVPAGCSKSDGIRRILEEQNLAGCRTLAIGDSENDIDMIKAVDIGIAMKNSPKELLDAADFITGTLEEDGVITALQRYF